MDRGSRNDSVLEELPELRWFVFNVPLISFCHDDPGIALDIFPCSKLTRYH